MEVLVESESDEAVAGGGFCPSDITMGVGLAPPSFLSPPLPVSESNCGGQSTDVGGQLSVLLEREEG